MQRIRERIAAAAQRAGRDPAGVGLIGVTKTVPASRVRAALEAGLEHVGENRVQEARAKAAELGADAERLTWHGIGHLQSNKAKAAVLLFDWIHAVDSLALARELDRRAAEAGRRIPVLLEVNASGEATKFGVSPGRALDELAAVMELGHLEARGFMTMAAPSADPEASRPAFREVAKLLGEARRRFPERRFDQLSMGMSGDFEVAIEEGATWVRIGTALFGSRGAGEERR